MIDKRKRNDRQNNWQKENSDRLNFLMPKGTKERIQSAAGDLKIKASEFVRMAINEKLSKVENN